MDDALEFDGRTSTQCMVDGKSHGTWSLTDLLKKKECCYYLKLPGPEKAAGGAAWATLIS